MERTLLFASLFVAAVAWAGAFVFHRPANAEGSRLEAIPARERPYWWLALLLTAAVLMATLPSKPPFAPGSHFGLGYLLGSLLFMLAARLRWRNDESVPFSFLFASVVALTGVLALGGGAQDGLAGVATGAGTVSLLLGIAAGEKGEAAPWSRALKLGGAFAVLLTGMAALGLLRDDIATPTNPAAQNGIWTAAGIALATMLGLGAFIAETLTRQPRQWPGVLGRGGAALWEEDAADRSVGFILAAVLALGSAGFFSMVVLQETAFAVLFALGLLAGVLMMNLAREGEPETRIHGFAAPLATLIILGAFMASFSTLQGFGGAIMLLGAFIPLLFSPPARGGAALKVWSFGVALVVYRVFASRYAGPMRGVELSDNYALFGILLGALLPSLPAAIARDGAATSIPRTLSAGVLSLAAPSAVILFYGPKAGPSLLVGLALSSALRGYAFVSLWALLIGVSITQWGGHLFPLAELSRMERLRFLLLVAGGTAVVLIAAEIAGRLRNKK